MAKPVQITDTNFSAEVLQNDVIVLAGFWSEWRAASKKLMDTLVSVADENADVVKVVSLNIDQTPRTAANYAVLSVPTFIAFKNGQAIVRLEGKISKKDVAAKIKALVSAMHL